MIFSILVVIRDPLQGEEIKQTIQDFLDGQGHESIIHVASNVAEARTNIKSAGSAGYHLLVCHVHIPENRKTPVKTAEKRGLRLLQELAEEGLGMPSILIALDNKLFREVQLMKNVGLVEDGTESMFAELLELCSKFLTKESPSEKKAGPEMTPKIGKVNIYLKPKGELSISSMEGMNFNFHTRPDALQIDMEEIEELIGRSRRIEKFEDVKDWKDELRSIGKKIVKEIFGRNKDFDENFRDLVTEVGDEKNIIIHFDVEENIYPLVLEALLDERGEHRMLHTPLFRSVTMRKAGRQKNDILFVDKVNERPPVNCLIIAADASGQVVDANINCGKPCYLPQLPEIMYEAKSIYDYFQSNKNKFNIRQVEIVKPKRNSTFKDDLNEFLTNNTWDLIHYSGHSYFDPVSQTGYFFYPDKNKPTPVKSDNFCHTLRHKNKTQFIYLSSCQSSGADFVLRLAQQMIPAIVGFRWEIDDDKATEYALLFYKNLFAKNKSLPYAFLETRQEVYDKYSDNRIWAAAMLIIQGA